MRTAIDRFGRVVIPKSMRERLGLRAGTAIEIEEDGNRISLRAVENVSFLAMKEGILVFIGEATGDIEAAVAADRTDRALHIGGASSR